MTDRIKITEDDIDVFEWIKSDESLDRFKLVIDCKDEEKAEQLKQQILEDHEFRERIMSIIPSLKFDKLKNLLEDAEKWRKLNSGFQEPVDWNKIQFVAVSEYKHENPIITEFNTHNDCLEQENKQLKEKMKQNEELREKIVDLADIWDGKESIKYGTSLGRILKECNIHDVPRFYLDGSIDSITKEMLDEYPKISDQPIYETRAAPKKDRPTLSQQNKQLREKIEKIKKWIEKTRKENENELNHVSGTSEFWQGRCSGYLWASDEIQRIVGKEK